MIKVKKSDLNPLLNSLRKTYTLFAPVTVDGVTSFAEVSSSADMVTDIINTRKSPKELFFPQTEILFSYNEEGIADERSEAKPVAIWGMRPCDARSLTMLDKVFGSAIQRPDDEYFQDSHWKEKYDSALIFVIACNEPASTCFCNWFESGPHDERGADVFVIDIGNSYLLKPVSEKGTAYCEGITEAKSSSADTARAAELKTGAENMLGKPVKLHGLDKKLPELWNEGIWDELSAKCINCAACTYVCSTCHCFDIQDEQKGSAGKRLRLWDSCMYPLFTKEASGHNTRPLSRDRVRQRVMHKFSYFADKYDEYLCTGCGRCVQVCPVNFDIRQVIKKLLTPN